MAIFIALSVLFYKLISAVGESGGVSYNFFSCSCGDCADLSGSELDETWHVLFSKVIYVQTHHRSYRAFVMEQLVVQRVVLT